MKNTKRRGFSTKKNITILTIQKSGSIKTSDIKHSKNFMERNTSTPKTGNNIVDKGKARALYNGGWSLDMIAREMGITEQEVDEALSYYDEYGNWKGEE